MREEGGGGGERREDGRRKRGGMREERGGGGERKDDPLAPSVIALVQDGGPPSARATVRAASHVEAGVAGGCGLEAAAAVPGDERAKSHGRGCFVLYIYKALGELHRRCGWTQHGKLARLNP